MTEEPALRAPDESGRNPEKQDKRSEADELLHDLGTPLTIVSGYVQLIRRRNRGQPGREADALERSLDAMEDAIERMREVVLNHRNTDCSAGAGETDSSD